MNAEVENYLTRIEDLRGQVTDLIKDLPADALNWRPFEEEEDHRSNSLAVLAAHIAGAEHFWIGEVIGGKPPTREREAEFTTHVSDPSPLVSYLGIIAAETKAVFSELDASDLGGTRAVREREIPVRWCVLHVIDHTALHLGHMQLTYQLWSGGKSLPSPFWYERLR